MNNIWIISDTHFNHQAIIDEFEMRPADFKQRIIKHLLRCTKPWDIIIHLWDVIFDDNKELKTILWGFQDRQLILVKWNHDTKTDSWYRFQWFHFVCERFDIRYGGKDIIFTHIPIRTYKHWQLNIHWHLHSGWGSRWSYKKDAMHFCYSAERQHYQPLSLNSILDKVKKWIYF